MGDSEPHQRRNLEQGPSGGGPQAIALLGRAFVEPNQATGANLRHTATVLSKALFFGLPVHGHTNPTLPLVRELVRRGEEIVYLSTDEFAPLIAATGATYRPYRNAFLPQLGSVARRMDELAWLFMRTTAELLDEELDAYRAEKPDYVLTDSVAPWGQWMGEILGVPVVTSVTTFAFNRQVMRYGAAHGVRPKSARAFLSKLGHIARAVRLMRRLRRRYGVNGPGMMGTIGPCTSASALTMRRWCSRTIAGARRRRKRQPALDSSTCASGSVSPLDGS